MKLSKFTVPFIFALMLVVISTTLSAEQEPTGWREAPWRFNFSIWGWIPEAPADIKLGPVEEDLPEDLGTILDSLQFAAMLDLKVHKGRFGAYVTPIILFLDYKDSVQGPLQKHKLEIKESAILMDFGLSFEIGRWHLQKDHDYPLLTVEPFVGARWLLDDIDIDLDPGGTLKPEIAFIAPVIGLRTYWDLNERWNLHMEGDYGGFDVDGLEETYNLLGTVGYRFKMRGVSSKVFAGYRYLDIHYSEVADLKVTIRGPLVGIDFEFSSN